MNAVVRLSEHDRTGILSKARNGFYTVGYLTVFLEGRNRLIPLNNCKQWGKSEKARVIIYFNVINS